MVATDIIRMIKRPRTMDMVTLSELEKKLDLFPYCSTFRLLYLKNLHLLNTDKFSETLKNTAVLIPDRKMLFESIHETSVNSNDIQPTTAIYSVESAFDKEEDSEYLDNPFLSAFKNREKSAPDSEFYAGLSLTENGEDEPEAEEEFDLSAEDDFITESLALVFEKKGRIEEAIKTYEKLCLKYPEKISYFATQIQNLTKKL